MGEGICIAGGGSFCSDMKSVESGICAALKGSFCDSETDIHKWNRKLKEACGWDSQFVDFK